MQPDHTERVLNLAISMVVEAKQVTVPRLKLPLLLRIGVHSGAVVGGVIGITRIRFCVLGEAVNIAKRLISHTEAGRILVTSASKQWVVVAGGCIANTLPGTSPRQWTTPSSLPIRAS